MNKPSMQIGNIVICTNTPLVIPEIGINHNGSLDAAKEMVASASRAGAKIVKHQTHVISDEMSSDAKKVIPGNANVSIYDIMASCALNEEEESELKRYTEELGLEFLSTPFSRAAAERLERMQVNAYKIGSGEMNNYPLLDYVASFGKPMIVSTGMNSLASVDKAVTILEKRRVPYALLHTTNLYPTKPEQVRLGAMQELMTHYPDVPVGLSDHTVNNTACIAAISLGATIVERHFTDTFSRQGPDIICSMDESACKELIQAAHDIPMMRGGEKAPLKEEQVTIDFAFATVVAIKDIAPGEVFTLDNLWVKRPGKGGIPAEEFECILGKTSSRYIKNDTRLTRDMIRS